MYVCPACHGPLQDDGRQFVCSVDGVTGTWTCGFPDFTARAPIAQQSPGVLEENLRQSLVAVEHEAASRAELERHVMSQAGGSTGRGSERFFANYAKAAAEAGDRHGDAVLAKLDTWPLEASPRCRAAGRWTQAAEAVSTCAGSRRASSASC